MKTFNGIRHTASGDIHIERQSGSEDDRTVYYRIWAEYTEESRKCERRLNVDVWKHRDIFRRSKQIIWKPAEVNWSAIGSVRPETADLYAGLLTVAAEIARALDAEKWGVSK